MQIEFISLGNKEEILIKEKLKAFTEQKKKAIEDKNENVANSCWRKIAALELNVDYIEAFDKIKGKQFREGWEQLERCEINASLIIENSDDEFLQSARVYFIENAVKKLQSIYPYCLFLSPELLVGSQECSICKQIIKPRKRCSHKKGKLYYGEICFHIQRDITLKSISVVSKPVQKYSVFHSDKDLDFSVISYLMNILDCPFKEWDVMLTKKSHDISKFKRVSASSQCPCRSGLPFDNCCSSKSEIEIPHAEFIFNFPVCEDSLTDIFPY